MVGRAFSAGKESQTHMQIEAGKKAPTFAKKNKQHTRNVAVVFAFNLFVSLVPHPHSGVVRF